jgi:hypothetical protein
MTHDQLARVFPDGRTVHVPSDGNPLMGYELARADIEKRGDGDGASTKGLPNLFAALFKSKSGDDEDEGASAPVASDKPAPASVTASAAPARSADPVPVPRAKPAAAATFQLASADVQIVQPAKPKQAASPDKQAVSAGKAEAKVETPADVINARGFWGDTTTTPRQATPAQVAALNARKAIETADPQPTASVSSPLQALAYAPAANAPVDRANIVAASAPIPRNIRPASAPRNAMASTKIDLIVAKGPQGQGSLVATSTRLAASGASDTWMRMMILAPSASTSMNATVLGDVDMTLMRSYFVKPDAAIAMSFSDDPMMGMACDHFAGSATATLATQSFVTRTAALTR